jgi:hypothetical protein
MSGLSSSFFDRFPENLMASSRRASQWNLKGRERSRQALQIFWNIGESLRTIAALLSRKGLVS